MTKNESKQMTLFEAARIALTVEEGDEIQIEAQDVFFRMVEGEITDSQHDALSTYCDGATVPEMIVEGLRLVFQNRCGDEPATILDRIPLYLREFPGFKLDVQIPEGFVDCSWHNDACPSWSSERLGLRLWIDYKNPSQRDVDGVARFSVTDDLFLISVQSESWDEIAERILIHRVACDFVGLMTEGVPSATVAKLQNGQITFGDLGVDANLVMEQALTQNGIKVFCDQGHIHDGTKHLWNLAYGVALSFYLPLVGVAS